MTKTILRIIESVLKNLSPDLRKEVTNFILILEAKAEKTKNPFDDLLVMILKIAFGV